MIVLDLLLLGFNLLPIYPLDGGQILALLWFVLGRARGLQVCSVIGMIGGAAGFVRGGRRGRGLVDCAVGVRRHSGRFQDGSKPGHCLLVAARGGPCPRHGLGAARGCGGGGIAECDQALALMPEGQRAREDAYACRATAWTVLGEDAKALVDGENAIR